MPGWHYRNQVWVASSDPAVMLAIGIHGQFIYMDKGRDLVVVILSSHPAPLEVSLYMETLAMIMAIASGVSWDPRIRISVPTKSTHLDLQRASGREPLSSVVSAPVAGSIKATLSVGLQ